MDERKEAMIIMSEMNHDKLKRYIKSTTANVTSKAYVFADHYHVCFGGDLTTFHDKNGRILRFT